MFVVYYMSKDGTDKFQIEEDAATAHEIYEEIWNQTDVETAGWGPIICSSDLPHEMPQRTPVNTALFTKILLEHDPEFDLVEADLFEPLLDELMPAIIDYARYSRLSLSEAAAQLWPYIYDPHQLEPQKDFPFRDSKKFNMFVSYLKGIHEILNP